MVAYSALEKLERVKGIEPSSSDWKSEALAIELHPHEGEPYRPSLGRMKPVHRKRWPPQTGVTVPSA